MYGLQVVEDSSVPRVVTATMIVIVSDLCLFLANVTKRQAKGAKKSEQDFDDRMDRSTVVDAQYVDAQYVKR